MQISSNINSNWCALKVNLFWLLPYFRERVKKWFFQDHVRNVLSNILTKSFVHAQLDQGPGWCKTKRHRNTEQKCTFPQIIYHHFFLVPYDPFWVPSCYSGKCLENFDRSNPLTFCRHELHIWKAHFAKYCGFTVTTCQGSHHK